MPVGYGYCQICSRLVRRSEYDDCPRCGCSLTLDTTDTDDWDTARLWQDRLAQRQEQRTLAYYTLRNRRAERAAYARAHAHAHIDDTR